MPGAVVGFTDRPARRVNNESLASFAARWQRRGFAADPPNAALVIDDAPVGGDVVVVQLLSRRLLSAGIIRYRVRTLAAPGARSPLARLARRADRGAQRTFGRASLYVDPSTGTLATIRLTIPALAANQIASLIFDDPYQVASTRTALSGTGMVETELNAVVVFAGSGGVSSTLSIINLSGGGATISGIAELPDGVSVTVQVIGPGSPGPAQTFSTSAFELTVPQ